MVVLNKYISFEKIRLNNNLNKYINENIRLDFILNLDEIIIEKIKMKINKTINEFFENDYQIYNSMNNNHCTYKHRKGMKEGHYCCKKITKNGNKKKYLCTKHNPEHIPEKKAKKAKIMEITKINNNRIINNTNSRDNKVIVFKKSNKNKFKKKLKNKIIVHGEINFKNIIKKLIA